MAEIYSPWQQPEEDNDIFLASLEFAQDPEMLEESMEPEPNAALMAQAMSTMQKQADTITALVAMMTGNSQ